MGSRRVPEKNHWNMSLVLQLFGAHLQFTGLRVLGGNYSLWAHFKSFSVHECFSSPRYHEERLNRLYFHLNRCRKQQQKPLRWKQQIVQWLLHLRCHHSLREDVLNAQDQFCNVHNLFTEIATMHILFSQAGSV